MESPNNSSREKPYALTAAVSASSTAWRKSRTRLRLITG